MTTAVAADLDLQTFFPYRLAVLADEVSREVSAIYTERFELTRHEWRILAVLGGAGEKATKDIGRITTLDKMQVSRAMQQLETRGLIRRREDESDRRNKTVALTTAGRTLYRRIVPLALAREAEILASITPQERQVLDDVMSRLLTALAGRSSDA